MIADMYSNKKVYKITSDFLIRGKKLYVSLVFVSQSYFNAPKVVRLNTTPFLF